MAERAVPPPLSLKERYSSLVVGSSGGPITAVLLVVFFGAWIVVAATGGDFMTIDNIRSMLIRSVALGIVAIGQTLVILAGSLDLSVAYLISVTAVLSSVIMDGDPGRIALAVVVVVLIGGLVGLTNGLVITKLRVNAFIATLGMSLILKGLLTASFDNFSGAVPDDYQVLGYGRIGPFPWAVLLLAVLGGAVWYMLNRTRYGHHLFAVGGDFDTARLSGVRADWVIIRAHIFCSLTAVMTGLFIVSRLRAGAPWVGPDGAYDLQSIAAVVLGGTALAGGRGGVGGTIAGVFLLAILDNVFNQLGVNTFLKDVLRGVILIAAIAIYALQRKRAGR
jgi:ribose transport system permease protein